MYTLSKGSYPGWDKQFYSVDTLREELEGWICTLCFPRTEEKYQYLLEELSKGDAEECIDDHIDPTEYADLSPEEKIKYLLDTPCGCEYHVCSETDKVIYKE